MGVKLYLFHFLEVHQRRSQIAELSGLYRQTLEQLRRLHPRPGQPRSFPADYWLCHEIERLESELAWLEGLENWFSSRHACGVSELGVRAMMIWRGLEPTLIVRLLRRAGGPVNPGDQENGRRGANRPRSRFLHQPTAKPAGAAHAAKRRG
jgi:hypothetical protein